jgi:hypothetical protein
MESNHIGFLWSMGKQMPRKKTPFWHIPMIFPIYPTILNGVLFAIVSYDHKIGDRMKLAEFLSLSKMTQADFARATGLSQQVVGRYVYGHRVPRTEAMARIVAVTRGAVTPNDFYPAPVLPGAATPPAGASDYAAAGGFSRGAK